MSALRSDPSLAPQEIYANNITTSGIDLGARMTTGDGRVFRYALGSATALVAGKLYQSLPTDTANFQNLGVGAIAGTNTTTVTIGSTVTVASNLLAGGLLTVRSGQGAGFSYRVKSHPAVAAGSLTVTLEDPLVVALRTTSNIDITPNPYNGIIICPTTLTGIPVGVAVQNGTATGYAWIQTRGLCNVLSDTAVTVGVAVVPSANVAGAVQPMRGSLPVIGTAEITTVDTNYAPFFLQIE